MIRKHSLAHLEKKTEGSVNKMAKRKKKSIYDFSEEAIKKRRTFPTPRLILLIALIIVQVFFVLFMIFYEPTPQDKIEKYEIFVTPKDDGTLDIEYKIRWMPLDTSEPLSWVYIGVPNPEYTVLEYSSNIKSIEKYYDDYDMCHMDIEFKNNYVANQVFNFSVKINQRYMLCEDNGNKFYELVPCWFNSINVENYSFNWYDNGKISSSNSATKNGNWLNWSGSMEAGEYRLLRVNYSEFNAPTVRYQSFDDSGVGNSLEDDKWTAVFFGILIISFCFIVELFIIDCFVSYHRGRGFFRGYGHHMYIYGRSNPKYKEAEVRHNASHGGRGHGGGGCACACACACAGGGRAGCSQKDIGYRV